MEAVHLTGAAYEALKERPEILRCLPVENEGIEIFQHHHHCELNEAKGRLGSNLVATQVRQKFAIFESQVVSVQVVPVAMCLNRAHAITEVNVGA